MGFHLAQAQGATRCEGRTGRAVGATLAATHAALSRAALAATVTGG